MPTFNLSQLPGYRLEEPDDHTVELWYHDHLVATFVAQDATLGGIADHDEELVIAYTCPICETRIEATRPRALWLDYRCPVCGHEPLTVEERAELEYAAPPWMARVRKWTPPDNGLMKGALLPRRKS